MLPHPIAQVSRIVLGEGRLRPAGDAYEPVDVVLGGLERGEAEEVADVVLAYVVAGLGGCARVDDGLGNPAAAGLPGVKGGRAAAPAAGGGEGGWRGEMG